MLPQADTNHRFGRDVHLHIIMPLRSYSSFNYGAEVWQIPTREINNILCTEMDVLRRSARKSRLEKIKNENIKEIMGMKGKPDIIEKKRLQWYGHFKRIPEKRIPKLILEWVPAERRKRVCPRKTWMEGVYAAMTARNLEQNQWRNREDGVWFPEDGDSCHRTG
jgi:hypothetical protein